MRVEFRKTFEKDLKKLKDKSLLAKLKEAIETIEKADSLDAIANLKSSKATTAIFASVWETIELGYFWLGIPCSSSA